MGGRKEFRCGGDAPEPMPVDREAEIGGGRAALHLDERGDPSAPGDQIDLADWSAHATRDDPPAVKAQPPRGHGLGAPALALGMPAVAVHAFSAIARA